MPAPEAGSGEGFTGNPWISFARLGGLNLVFWKQVRIDVSGRTGGRSIDIYFFCGSCGQHMVIDEAGVGIVILCPRCARSVTVPTPSEPKSAPVSPPAAASQSEKEQTVALKWVPPPSVASKDKKS